MTPRNQAPGPLRRFRGLWFVRRGLSGRGPCFPGGDRRGCACAASSSPRPFQGRFSQGRFAAPDYAFAASSCCRADASIAARERLAWLRSVVYQKSGSEARR
ncbi:hypothetical protein Sm713_62070 [Streptomyces sp. TS71-3]|nr:hypothetical protein Sm713_62070 [Streptomyces sp. TS71-3]